MSSNPFQLYAYQGRTAADTPAPQIQSLPKRAPLLPSSATQGSGAADPMSESQHQDAALQEQQQLKSALISANMRQMSIPAAEHSATVLRSPGAQTPNPGKPLSSRPLSSPTTNKRQRITYSSLPGEPRGLPEKLGGAPLRLILIGHNPSEHAWHTGHYYSNPSNRMWPILIKSGIAPSGSTGCEADDLMPAAVGVGFTDVGICQPGTDSSRFTSEDFQQWRAGFYNRLVQHVIQASNSIGCKCGQCGAPAVLAFTGKRHYMELLNMGVLGNQLKGKARMKPAAVQLGRQPANQLPAGWPLAVNGSEVWVLTSTSGAAPMSNADRERPYAQLAERLKQIPWPRCDIQLRCNTTAAE